MNEVVNKTVKILEKEVDNQLDRLDNLSVNDFEILRQERLKQLKNEATQKQQWLLLSHGSYTELSSEKEFFEATKKSDNVICHFYDNTNIVSKIFEKHLKLLTKKHLETRFITINIDKCEFLRKKLVLTILPTVVMIKKSQIVGRLSGLRVFNNRTDFKTALFEWHLAQFDVFNYKHDLKNPPEDNDTYSSDDEN